MTETEPAPSAVRSGIGEDAGTLPGRARLALAVASAVEGVPGVALTAGAGVAVATQYRGGRVDGVLVDADRVTVQIVAGAWPLPRLVDAVRRAVAVVLAAAGDGRVVDVHVADLDPDALRP